MKSSVPVLTIYLLPRFFASKQNPTGSPSVSPTKVSEGREKNNDEVHDIYELRFASPRRLRCFSRSKPKQHATAARRGTSTFGGAHRDVCLVHKSNDFCSNLCLCIFRNLPTSEPYRKPVNVANEGTLKSNNLYRIEIASM